MKKVEYTLEQNIALIDGIAERLMEYEMKDEAEWLDSLSNRDKNDLARFIRQEIAASEKKRLIERKASASAE